MKRTLRITLLLSLAALAFAGNAKLSPDLIGLDPESQVDVIVQYKQTPTPTQPGLLGVLVGLIKQELSVVNGLLCTVQVKSLDQLTQDANVVYISKDRTVGGAADPVYDYTPQTTGAARLSSSSGSGVGVAVIDSGIASHPDLTGFLGLSRVVYQESFVPKDSNPSDAYGHGTHIAGIIAGNGLSSFGNLYFHQIKGVAPGANLINLRALDKNGAATDSVVIRAIQRAIELKTR